MRRWHMAAGNGKKPLRRLLGLSSRELLRCWLSCTHAVPPRQVAECHGREVRRLLQGLCRRQLQRLLWKERGARLSGVSCRRLLCARRFSANLVPCGLVLPDEQHVGAEAVHSWCVRTGVLVCVLPCAFL